MTQLTSRSYDTDDPSVDTDHLVKILIIEDQWPICQMYSATLCQANPYYDISFAYTGEEGVEAALRDRPDLVILDLALPGISGVEVIEKLREEGILPIVPLIIASGIGNDASEIAESIQPTAFLAKPFPASTLLSTVQNALSGSI